MLALFPSLILSLILLVPLASSLGQIAAGALVGFRFLTFAYGPLLVAQTARGTRVRLHRHMMFNQASVPMDRNDLNRRTSVWLLGAPAGAALLGLVSLLLFLTIAHSAGETVRTILLGVSLACSIGVLIDVLPIPPTFGGILRMVLQMLAGGQWADRFNARQLSVAHNVLGGVRPRDWDPSLIAVTTATYSGTFMDVFDSKRAYFWALDRGDIEAAGTFLDRALRGINAVPQQLRADFMQEGAFFEAQYRRRPDVARRWLNESGSGVHDRHIRLRAEAAVLLGEGRREEALIKAREGLAALQDGLWEGETVLAADLLQALVDDAQRDPE